MNDEITPEMFKYLAEQAEFELDADEAEYLLKQMNNQLKVIREMELVPLDPATPLASHGVPYSQTNSPLLREDEIISYPDPARLLAAAPKTEDGFVVVPDTPHKDLK